MQEYKPFSTPNKRHLAVSNHANNLYVLLDHVENDYSIWRYLMDELGPLVFLLLKSFKLVGFQIFWLWASPDECSYRNVSCTLNLIHLYIRVYYNGNTIINIYIYMYCMSRYQTIPSVVTINNSDSLTDIYHGQVFTVIYYELQCGCLKGNRNYIPFATTWVHPWLFDWVVFRIVLVLLWVLSLHSYKTTYFHYKEKLT